MMIKKRVVQAHFSDVLKRPPLHSRDLNWANIPVPECDLSNLDDPFLEEEVKCAIFGSSSDKALGPDGFTRAFYKSCWDIFKPKVMHAIQNFHNLHVANLHWVNSANIALIPKKDGAEEITDFRPISLIHAITKFIAKMMAARLAPHMDSLVSNAQSAFIKTRSIHDNFLYVRNLARKLHRSYTPCLLFKLDIKKAFDSVRWDYLMDLLRHSGFPPRFREWVWALLSTSTSRVLLNGVPCGPIKHGRGLRQGDPLSPLLFVLAIDPITHILRKATLQGFLHPINGQHTTPRISLYADDAAVFVAPIKEDVTFLAATLASFGDVTGLSANCQKSLVAPIRCDSIDLADVLDSFPATQTTFPMKYLGLPLSIFRLKRGDFQHLEDKIARKLAFGNWKNVNVAGRRVLVRAVLTSQAIYHLTALVIPKEVNKSIIALLRAYLWGGCDKVSGGKCKVNWEKVCRPTNLGGLGILNLEKFAAALRQRWLWNEWDDAPKPWVGLGNPCSATDNDLFAASTIVTVGNGEKATFWTSSWLNGLRPKDIAPKLYEGTKRKNITVKKGLQDNAWVTNLTIQNGLDIGYIQQFVSLWELLSDITLHNDRPDSIQWKFTNNGSYTAKSAYMMQFEGIIATSLDVSVWHAWAPPKCKFFAWLAIQNRIWTADRLQRRGWPNCGQCPLCNQVQESAAHLLYKCRFSVRVWKEILGWCGCHDINPATWTNEASVDAWWSKVTLDHGVARKAMSTLIMLISWEIWKERNARVFRHVAAPANVIIAKIKEEARAWCLAGAKFLGSVIPGE